jgi:GMP synthase (glutamine-hydrolysing)
MASREGCGCRNRERYGYAEVKAQRHNGHVGKLVKGLEDDLRVWMSPGDKLGALPPPFHTIAVTKNAPFAGIAHETKPVYSIQFHPEVTHTPRGISLLKNFAVGICGAKQDWTMTKFVDKEIARIRARVGEKGQVLGAVSGGVDSTVTAKLMHEAIGDRFHAVLVDNGCMRLSECSQVKKTLTEHLGFNLTVVDAGDLFLDALNSITDNPEQKRRVIGGLFIDVFEAEAKKIEERAANPPKAGPIKFFLQGTLYPDVIESISFKGPSQTIKTHHNLGGHPERMMNGQGLN